jgi:hypothetical protein
VGLVVWTQKTGKQKMIRPWGSEIKAKEPKQPNNISKNCEGCKGKRKRFKETIEKETPNEHNHFK